MSESEREKHISSHHEAEKEDENAEVEHEDDSQPESDTSPDDPSG
jgi:hypothetical protein